MITENVSKPRGRRRLVYVDKKKKKSPTSNITPNCGREKAKVSPLPLSRQAVLEVVATSVNQDNRTEETRASLFAECVMKTPNGFP